MGVELPRLNAIVDVDIAMQAGWRPVPFAAALLNGGARFLQIRAKRSSSAAFLDLCTQIVALARQADAIVIVNDRADVARLAGADGVHVGQTDLAPVLVRRIVGDQAIVGLSTHTLEQMDHAAAQPISYAAIGPIFGTTTKATGYNAVGVETVRAAAARAGGLPVVAIGGITVDTARSVIDAGASAIAVISDLLSTGDPERRTREFLEAIHERN